MPIQNRRSVSLMRLIKNRAMYLSRNGDRSEITVPEVYVICRNHPDIIDLNEYVAKNKIGKLFYLVMRECELQGIYVRLEKAPDANFRTRQPRRYSLVINPERVFLVRDGEEIKNVVRSKEERAKQKRDAAREQGLLSEEEIGVVLPVVSAEGLKKQIRRAISGEKDRKQIAQKVEKLVDVGGLGD